MYYISVTTILSQFDDDIHLIHNSEPIVLHSPYPYQFIVLLITFQGCCFCTFCVYIDIGERKRALRPYVGLNILALITYYDQMYKTIE